MGGPIHEVDLIVTMVEKEGAPLTRLHLVLSYKLCPMGATDICPPWLVGAQNSEASSGHRHLGQVDLKCPMVTNENANMVQEVTSSPTRDDLRKRTIEISVIIRIV